MAKSTKNLRVDGRPGPRTRRVVTAFTLNTTMQLYQRSLCGFKAHNEGFVLMEKHIFDLLTCADGVFIHCDTRG